MDIVVTIATYGRSNLLKRTLNSLSECKFPPEYTETIVVENGTREGAEGVVRSASRRLNARYMHVKQGNKSAALNLAINTLGDCLVYFTDDDVRFAPGTLCSYAEAMRRQKGCFFGGPLNVDYEEPPPQWLREYLPYSAKGWALKEAQGWMDSVRFIGSNWAAYAEDLRAAGGFDVHRGPGSSFGSVGDETDMQDRLVKRGVNPVYIPDAYIWHYVPAERCSPDWLIARNYSHGVEDGARAIGELSKPMNIPPRWMLYRYVKGIGRAVMWSLSSEPELRFKAKNRLSYDRGLIRGVSLQNELAKFPTRGFLKAA